MLCLTSGVPFGSIYASGMASWAFDFGFSEGGLGFAEYSVKARPVGLCNRGEAMPLIPLIPLTPFSGVVGRE